MKIKFLNDETYDNGKFKYDAGKTYDVDEAFAKRWIARKKVVVDEDCKNPLSDPRTTKNVVEQKKEEKINEEITVEKSTEEIKPKKKRRTRKKTVQ